MTQIIVAFGILIGVAGVLIVIEPEVVFRPLRNNSKNLWIHVVAVVVRLILGALLILTAQESKFPAVIEVLGVLLVIAAAVLAIIGRRRFIAVMGWAVGLVKTWGRASGVLGAAFGGFLVYAFV